MFLSAGAGGLAFKKHLPLPSNLPYLFGGVGILDANGDGAPDFVLSQTAPQNAVILLSNP